MDTYIQGTNSNIKVSKEPLKVGQNVDSYTDLCANVTVEEARLTSGRLQTKCLRENLQDKMATTSNEKPNTGDLKH